MSSRICSAASKQDPKCLSPEVLARYSTPEDEAELTHRPRAMFVYTDTSSLMVSYGESLVRSTGELNKEWSVFLIGECCVYFLFCFLLLPSHGNQHEIIKNRQSGLSERYFESSTPSQVWLINPFLGGVFWFSTAPERVVKILIFQP